MAGFDLLLDEHNDVYAIDLNFRQNGSTSMLLLADELTNGYHKFYSYFSDGNNDHFFNTILKYVKKEYYIHYLITTVTGTASIKSIQDLDVYGMVKIKHIFNKWKKHF